MTVNDVIPQKLRDLIDTDARLRAIYPAADKLLAILGNQNTALFFFPEYTDHGPAHVKGVLATAVQLIHEKAWDQFTCNDAAILTLSAFLHDAAMVLTGDGLVSLVDNRNPVIAKLDGRSWSDLFDEFFAEARQWDGRKLFRVLGDQEKDPDKETDKDDLTRYIVHVRERRDPEEWEARYRKFLGEFVRRHHGRIAHEIALYGFPGKKGASLDPILGHEPNEIPDLAGFVARSHTVPLRSTYSYLKGQYDGRAKVRAAHPLYLMVLLRIADYLQVDANRANSGWASIQRLRSPISQDEWDAHLAVKEVRNDEEDPEALCIVAVPPSARVFVKIKKVLSGLQSELDVSWAVISEIFGRYTDLCRLGITLRRVRSNLDDEKQYLEQHSPAYFPMDAKFDTAGASLLKLLIKPLYENNPAIGVRELLQNALDAVRELRQFRLDHPEISDVLLPDQEADVLISVDRVPDGYYYLTVTDKGIGMTAETVRDYFLKAGASFRQSDAWRREFTLDNKSKVLRSGRFGIGVLAAFLLGDRIEVRTRHVVQGPEDGVAFTAGIDDESIEIDRVNLPFVGTTVKVLLGSDTLKKLRAGTKPDRYGRDSSYAWDWYGLDDPVVERRFLGKNLEQRLLAPGKPESSDDGEWLVVRHPDFQAVHWSNPMGYHGSLTCNGIRVGSSGGQRSNLGSYYMSSTADPFGSNTYISVLDKDSRLPLTLKRDAVEQWLVPFEKELAADMTKDLCACLLMHSPCSPRDHLSPVYQHGAWWWDFSSYLGQIKATCGPLGIAKNGAVMLHPWHLKRGAFERVWWASIDISGVVDDERFCTGRALVIPTAQSEKEFVWLMCGLAGLSEKAFLGTRERAKALRYARDVGSVSRGLRRWFKGARCYVSKKNDVAGPGYPADESATVQADWRRLVSALPPKRRDDIGKTGQMITIGEPGADDGEMRYLLSRMRYKGLVSVVVVELWLNLGGLSVPRSPFAEYWTKTMKSPVIPYDLDERRTVFAQAFAELKDYIERWKSPCKGTWRDRAMRSL